MAHEKVYSSHRALRTAIGSYNDFLAHNLKLHNPTGKNEAADLNRGPVVTR
jgi:hypothetical protein